LAGGRPQNGTGHEKVPPLRGAPKGLFEVKEKGPLYNKIKQELFNNRTSSLELDLFDRS